VRGLLQSRSLIRSFRPDVAVGTGGYVSGPVLWAASRAGVPTVLQEQNAFAGKTNKMLAARASQIHIAFADAEKWFPEGRCLLSGNPTRKELLDSDRGTARRYFGIDGDQKVILVFGGSLGSAAMNQVFAEKYQEVLEAPDTFLIWQTGSRYFDRYDKALTKHPRLKLLQYIERMDHAYAAADVVVCRAGAISCSELELTGSPSILIPSPNVAEDHQTYNARSLADDGAAVLMPESQMAAEIVTAIKTLLRDEPRRLAMVERLKRRARPDAADTIARSILELIASESGVHQTGDHSSRDEVSPVEGGS
jgi:UDP-N-acetylglucosamine--N-acetylmuramyl-(pentapeptide) pyrophosphoryl-undecaprenol N-acetylglucosamine transferase